MHRGPLPECRREDSSPFRLEIGLLTQAPLRHHSACRWPWPMVFTLCPPDGAVVQGVASGAPDWVKNPTWSFRRQLVSWDLCPHPIPSCLHRELFRPDSAESP